MYKYNDNILYVTLYLTAPGSDAGNKSLLKGL